MEHSVQCSRCCKLIYGSDETLHNNIQLLINETYILSKYSISEFSLSIRIPILSKNPF